MCDKQMMRRALKYLERVRWPRTQAEALRREGNSRHVLCRLASSLPRNSFLRLVLFYMRYHLQRNGQVDWERNRKIALFIIGRKLCSTHTKT